MYLLIFCKNWPTSSWLSIIRSHPFFYYIVIPFKITVHRCHLQDRPGITSKLSSPMKWCVWQFGSSGVDWNVLSCSGSQKQLKPHYYFLEWIHSNVPSIPKNQILENSKNKKIAPCRHCQNPGKLSAPFSLVFQPYNPMVTSMLWYY